MKHLARLLPLALLAACASERVVLLPSADGRQSAVVVRSPAGERLLSEPYAATVRRGSSLETYQASPQDVQERFGAALAAQPARAASFIVYFVEGSDTLTPESLPELERLKADMAGRTAAEVLVVGHTDRVGSLQANDALSLKRAQVVREALIAAGFPDKIIEVAGRGEREPLVPTEDEIAEAKNRRVEITVR